MVVLMNFGPHAQKVEYKSGNKAFFKQVPPNYFVALKSLKTHTQISNLKFLAGHANLTIYDYDSNTFYHKNAATPTGATMQFMFIDHNKQPDTALKFSATGLTAGYAQLAKLV